ncbi:hypothetical protein JMJ77_0009416 [Colletotrichum scovillei]|uniref:Uncharacterized protein n=1 Tax=Colletotrichum scovillei TaxID=1209932 RepID=A0A9P7R179_9PEZI|nr:hypothetical protein JMJ77_0009416 [Colletotrichum scovillei]KAG7052495.1 hypothetical protein JMJ78_0005511 [Colletotrichum scovillei]KAG7064786.1 hypothetical protein JMJ76_0012544 [Colletotrichum scovillei]
MYTCDNGSGTRTSKGV